MAPPSPAGPVPRKRIRDERRPYRPDRGGGFPCQSRWIGERARPGESIVQRAGRAFEGELRTGLRVLLVVAGVAGGWMTLVPLAGAVVVPGNLVVQSNVKTIQHPTGGVVAQIPVHNGMRVNAGDLLLRLDCDAGAGQPPGGEQATRRGAGEDRAAGRRARWPAQAEIPPELAGRLDDNNVKSRAGLGDVAVPGARDARESQKELLQEQGIAAQRGDRRPRGAGRIEGQAAGTDLGRTGRACRISMTSGWCR